MKFLDNLKAKTFMDSLTDIVYLVDLEGAIIAYNERNWNDFAINNRTPELADPLSVIGKSIYSFIADEETRSSYKKFAEALTNKIRDSVMFFYRCDAPEVKREMRMAITLVQPDNRPAALMYHSITLTEELRPPVNILNPLKIGTDDSGIPVLGICSYCKDVRIEPDTGPGKSVIAEMFGQAMSVKEPVDNSKAIWVTPERYYQLGGTERVILSHGICPKCYQDIVAPMISQLKVK